MSMGLESHAGRACDKPRITDARAQHEMRRTCEVRRIWKGEAS